MLLSNVCHFQHLFDYHVRFAYLFYLLVSPLHVAFNYGQAFHYYRILWQPQQHLLHVGIYQLFAEFALLNASN